MNKGKVEKAEKIKYRENMPYPAADIHLKPQTRLRLLD
jgi:hypothetical protein